jgi:hypothetical protein
MTARERILDRLTKLLALERSPNTNEAATAARMAVGLMKKHGLTKADVVGYLPSGFYEKAMGAKGFETVWKSSLLTATARFCGCEAILLRAGSRRKARLVGDRETVEQAADLWASLLKTMLDLERMEASRASDLSVPIYSSPKQYVDSFRRGATVAIIEMMMHKRPSRFGMRRHSRGANETASSPPDSPSASPASPAASEWNLPKVKRSSWFSGFWPATWKRQSKHNEQVLFSGLSLPPQPPPTASQGLVVVPKQAENDYKEKVKAKYAPRQVKLDLEDAADDDAYWRGYQLARALVVLPTDSTPVDSSGSASPQGERKAKTSS